MKIFQLSNDTAPGPAPDSRRLAACARALHDAGHTVLLVAPEAAEHHAPGRAPRFTRTLAPGDEVAPSPRAPLAPDLVHAHHPFLAGEEALRLAAEHDAPLVFTAGRGYSPPLPMAAAEAAGLAGFLDTLGICFANRCDAVVAPCPVSAVRLFERGVIRPIHVVPEADGPETAETAARRLIEIYDETLRRRRARGPVRDCARSAPLRRELALAWARVTNPASTARGPRFRGALASFRDGAALTC